MSSDSAWGIEPPKDAGGQGNPAGHGGAVLEERKEGMEMKEEAMEMSPALTATIKLDSWWNHPERHGAMFDLAASEDVKLREGEVKVIPLGIRMKLPDGYFGLVVPRSSTCLKCGIMMANSVGIIEPDYCGDSDVWGFVAYATRGTKIPKGTRIAQFMPVRMFGDLDFAVVDSMPYLDRGGYGSTGEMSAGASTAEGRTFRDANGLELHVGDYVIDELGECFCVMGLNGEDGATAAYADLGNSRTSLEVAPCLSLRLDERPHDRERLVGLPLSVETHAPRARQLREDSGRCRYELGRLLRESPPGRKRRHRDRGARYAGRHPAPHEGGGCTWLATKSAVRRHRSCATPPCTHAARPPIGGCACTRP